ncbi:hypothetical protein ILYODFUR_023667 [Ilyodon furcidens]|uniref:protein-tyrosine-phosphatase n=1 Tax=Ilyodon furcidens TaxID=33524 RepID=A0ABV0T178_9TELE
MTSPSSLANLLTRSFPETSGRAAQTVSEELKIKCDQYWPSRGTETYGTIRVTILDTLEVATYVTRVFNLYQNGSCEKRHVHQFQFLAWPDHGVPEHPTTALAFLRRVRACNSPDAGPIVVHCSGLQARCRVHPGQVASPSQSNTGQRTRHTPIHT